MKRWNGIEMGFRKRDEKEQLRRRLRANEIMLKYAREKGHDVEVVMSNELHTYDKVIMHSCSMCIESGLEAEDCLLSVNFIKSFMTRNDEMVLDFETWMNNVVNSKEWQQYPVLHLECERGHVGEILLNQVLISGRYPVYMKYSNMGISWLEDGLAMGDISGLIDAGRWPVKEEE